MSLGRCPAASLLVPLLGTRQAEILGWVEKLGVALHAGAVMGPAAACGIWEREGQSEGVVGCRR